MQKMTINTTRLAQVLVSMLVTFIILRVYLHVFPGTNFDVAGYNIHHLYTGLVLITLSGLPLTCFHGKSRLLDFAAIMFGVGLSMALDEWVYLIATDGSDKSYLLPVSFWGAVCVIGLTLVYAVILVVLNGWFNKRIINNE